MHDLTFSKEIIDAINDKSRTLPSGIKITAVNASLSLISHVKPETLKETFSVMVKGTPLEKISLNITIMKLSVKCRSCKNEFAVIKPVTECPKCNSADLDIVYSKEFAVDSVEVTEKATKS